MRKLLSAAVRGVSGRGFPRAAKGSALIEFTLVLPFLLALMLGSVEVFRFVLTVKNCVEAANSMGEMLSSTQLPLAASDLQFVSDSGMITVPQVLAEARRQSVAWGTILQSSYASVVVTPTVPGCTSGCTYRADVAWSAGPNRRPCGRLYPSADGAAYAATSLPQSLFQPGSLIVVDSRYAYRPLFGGAVVGPRTLTRSSYFVPRYVSRVALGDMSANPSLATSCPGV